MVAVTAKVELSGNLFRRDPSKTLYANLRDMLDALGQELEKQTQDQFAAHQDDMPGWTGWSHDKVVGYTTSKKTGKRWATWVAVGSVTEGMSAKDAIRTKAAAAQIERRFHPYRNVKQGVYRARALLRADLAKGMN